MVKLDYCYAWIKPESEADWLQEYASVWCKSPKKKSAKVV